MELAHHHPQDAGPSRRRKTDGIRVLGQIGAGLKATGLLHCLASGLCPGPLKGMPVSSLRMVGVHLVSRNPL